ncbi:MAG: hypothetical protein NDP13_00110 [Crenarchaeota archaeon]|nr:hypothetical protein [Thermoproteota archaeon]MCR8453396.1 hypothetical protein [Thermoproteota archaeon]MCR8455701.1 hypothetical protein [Thermoproteota archaeon]MCR8462538.1 hypothetical protein [Thermoproteota archaeon]MCR8470734.1 hypothetical protein [Thermoproteota archaeon]
MGFGLELEIRNVKLKVPTEQKGGISRLTSSPFPFAEILVSDDKLKARLLARFSNLEGSVPSLDSILRALQSVVDFAVPVFIRVGQFYELKIDLDKKLVTATGLADGRTKTFKLEDVRRFNLGEIWRRIYEF